MQFAGQGDVPVVPTIIDGAVHLDDTVEAPHHVNEYLGVSAPVHDALQPDNAPIGTGLGGRIRLAPMTDDLTPWYRAADVLVSVSDVESMPRSAIQAMACGTPVLAAAVYGVSELVEDGFTGWIFEACIVTRWRRASSVCSPSPWVSSRNTAGAPRNGSTAITIRPAMSTNTSDFSANSSIVIRPGRGDRAVPPRRVGEVVAEGIGGRPSRTRGTMMHG